MHRRATPLVLVSMAAGLLVAACLGRDSPEESETDMTAGEIPLHHSLVHFIQQRVYTLDAPEITWDGFHSMEPPDSLVAFYVKELGERGFEARAEGGLWRLPPDGPTMTLDILPTSADGPHEPHRDSIPRGARTVVIISRR